MNEEAVDFTGLFCLHEVILLTPCSSFALSTECAAIEVNLCLRTRMTLSTFTKKKHVA
jgi:hypothetical protein